MKIQLDTEKKTIKLEQNVELSKLVDLLEGLLPNEKWKEFTLETNTVIQHWSSPIVIREREIIPSYPRTYPWWSQPITYMANKQNADYKLNSGVFNMELKA